MAALPMAALLLLPFASNSISRGAQEAASAITRGSVLGDPLARTAELITTLGLAALPLFAFGSIGILIAVRNPTTALRFVHAPALIYLAAVVGLVAGGAYSGSDRYLYPALPSLALLAASALDRQRTVVRLATAASGALLAVAFLPVFASFAAGNNGLIAAGQAAGANPGILVTDSPVAAYYSGKSPTQITGSQSLPLDRDQALQWLRSHGVSSVIVENISYYRATAVFPELARGAPTPPFGPLGEERSYQAAGGKQVYAYSVGGPRDLQAILPGVYAAIQPGQHDGKTAQLAKGVTLVAGVRDAAGEGMGLGVPIVRYPDGWVFPRTSTTVDLSTTTQSVWRRTFELDEMGGNAVAGGGFDFTPVASRGHIAVTYTVDASGITIEVEALQLAPGYTQVGILNEESGAFNNFADSSQTLIDSRFGSWVPVTGEWARLRSGGLGVEWSLPSLPGAQLYGGREVNAPSFDWAGLDYIFSGPFSGARYHINVQEAK